MRCKSDRVTKYQICRIDSCRCLFNSVDELMEVVRTTTYRGRDNQRVVHEDVFHADLKLHLLSTETLDDDTVNDDEVTL